MSEEYTKCVEKFETDFRKIYDKGTWSPDDIRTMKDLQKLAYYMEVRHAMKEGYEDEEDNSRSYANRPGGYQAGRSRMRYTDSRGYGTRYPERYYYDSEKESAVHELHRIMDSKNDPEVRMAIQDVIRLIEGK